MAKDKDNGLFNFPSKDSRGRIDSYEGGGEVDKEMKPIYKEGGKVKRNYKEERRAKMKAHQKKSKPLIAEARKAGHGRGAAEYIAEEVIDVLEGKAAPIGTKLQTREQARKGELPKKDITDIVKEVEYHLPYRKKKKKKKKK